MLVDRAFTNLFRTTSAKRDANAAANDADADQTGVRLRTLPPRPSVDVTIALDDQLFTALARDLTPTAILIVTARLLVPGTRVALAIDLPEGEVVARGTVRELPRTARRGTPEFMIDLDPLAKRDRDALAGYCAS
jgi:hypothetical protein